MGQESEKGRRVPLADEGRARKKSLVFFGIINVIKITKWKLSEVASLVHTINSRSLHFFYTRKQLFLCFFVLLGNCYQTYCKANHTTIEQKVSTMKSA
ncbi:hypothetical protein GDO81_009655 [Engystomops pustulosus]|uniref:Uncharacterized protein n=1 Tax=Engystomops pustulosus TaxID=76066 RepID=A0AAV7BT34_ENGPU|nr:hypothetical protein GDO81_009655 [Engystomops pustulosus]